MAHFFFLSTTGDDANGGSSEGPPKAAGTDAATTQFSDVVDLSADAPELGTVAPGDTIRLAGRTDGLQGSDVFVIVSVDTLAQSVTVAPAPGSTTTGVMWAIGGAWATPQRAMDVVGPGDTVWWKADGTYTDDSDGDGICARILRAGTVGAPIVFAGYRDVPGDAEALLLDVSIRPGDPEVDGYRATIDGTVGGPSYGIRVDTGVPPGTRLYYEFRHVCVRGCTTGVLTSGQFARNVSLKHCRVTGQSSQGADLGNESHVEGCSFDNNTGSGIYIGASSVVVGNDVFGNGNFGVDARGVQTLVGDNLIVGNVGGAVSALNAAGPVMVVGNTLVGQGQPGEAGLLLQNATLVAFANNIVHGFDVGVYSHAMVATAGVRNNLFSGNNADRYQFPAGPGDRTMDDPGFVDAAAGDYRLRFDSPARGAGMPAYRDLGALPRRELAPRGPVEVGVQA